MAEAIIDNFLNGNFSQQFTVIPGIPNTVIKIQQLFVSHGALDGTIGIRLKDGNQLLTGFLSRTFVLPAIPTEAPWFTLSPGNSFTIDAIAGGAIGGRVYYTQA